MGEVATIRSPDQARERQLMEDAFPAVDCMNAALGNSVIVQMRRSSRKSAGGRIILPDETRDQDRSMIRVAKVVEIGPIAYKFRESKGTHNAGDPWPEGAWVKVGDFVRVPSYAGADTWRVWIGAHKEQRGNKEIEVDDWVTFAQFNDYDMKTRIRGNPLDIIDYV